MRAKEKILSVAVLLACTCLGLESRAQDPLQRLDPSRFGPGTLIVAMEELESYRPSQAVQPVQALLGHRDPQVARTAGWLLRRMGRGSAGVTAASEVLANAEATVESRISAAIALGELREAGSISALTAALAGDGQAPVRAATARALGELHRTGAATVLVEALRQDPDAQVRRAAARALGNVPDAQAGHFNQSLHDEDVFVQLESVWALGRLGQSEAAGNLRGKLQDSSADCRVQAAAAWALARVGDALDMEALQSAVEQSGCKLTVEAANWALIESLP